MEVLHVFFTCGCCPASSFLITDPSASLNRIFSSSSPEPAATAGAVAAGAVAAGVEAGAGAGASTAGGTPLEEPLDGGNGWKGSEAGMEEAAAAAGAKGFGGC